MRKEVRFNFFILGIVFIISLILISNLAFAKEIIQVPQEQVAQKEAPKNFLGVIGSVVTSAWFLGLVIFLLILLGVIMLIVWIVRTIIKYYKLQNDAIYRIRTERVKLAFAQKKIPVNHAFWQFWSYPKTCPIRLARTDENGKLRLSNPVAYYRGDFQSHEGNIYLVFNMEGNHHLWGLIPQVELLVIPNKSEIDIKEIDSKKESIQTITIKNLPLAKDIIQFNENEILLYAEGISNAGYFYYPVLKTKDGKLIDLSIPVYESIREVALTNMMYIQTDQFSQVSKKMIDLNPNARYINKVNDTNQSVEVPVSSGSGGG